MAGPTACEPRHRAAVWLTVAVVVGLQPTSPGWRMCNRRARRFFRVILGADRALPAGEGVGLPCMPTQLPGRWVVHRACTPTCTPRAPSVSPSPLIPPGTRTGCTVHGAPTPRPCRARWAALPPGGAIHAKIDRSPGVAGGAAAGRAPAITGPTTLLHRRRAGCVVDNQTVMRPGWPPIVPLRYLAGRQQRTHGGC